MGKIATRLALVAVGLLGLAAAAPRVADGQERGSRLDAIVKAKKVRVGVAQFAPFVYKNPKTNELEGFEIDSARALAKELGVELELVEASWPTLFAGLQTGKYDIVMSGSKRTLQRALTVAFTEPYVSLTEYVMVRRRDNVKSWGDIDRRGNTIASVLGGAAHLAIQNRPEAVKNATITPFKDLTLCGNAVLSGQATAWVEDVVSISTFIKEHPDAGLQMLEVPFASHGEGNGYAVARGDLDLLNWLNIFVTKMKNTGAYVKLAEKHGLPPSILVPGWGQR